MEREHLLLLLRSNKLDVGYFYGYWQENVEEKYKNLDINVFSQMLQSYIMRKKPFLALHSGLMKEHNIIVVYNKDNKILNFY